MAIEQPYALIPEGREVVEKGQVREEQGKVGINSTKSLVIINQFVLNIKGVDRVWRKY